MATRCGVSMTRRKWMYLLTTCVVLYPLLMLIFWPKGRKTATPKITIHWDSALVQLHSDTPGASIYFTKDGSVPSGRSVLELYTGPFRLRAGTWQITAIAKKKDYTESEVARSSDLECRMEEDFSNVFCEAKGPDPGAEILSAGGNKPSYFSSLTASSPGQKDSTLSTANLTVRGCTFPARKNLREVRDVFSEPNLTLIKVDETWDRDNPVEVSSAGSTTKDFCRGVDSREWEECFKYDGRKQLAVSSGIDRVYIAAVSCGFLGFAPRQRKERVEGRSGSLGGVAMDAERVFRHQPFVPMGSTAAPAADETFEYHDKLALGTMGKPGAAEAIHEVLPQMIYLAMHLPPDAKILADVGEGFLRPLLALLRSSGMSELLAESRIVQWEPKLYVAGTLYMYGEWPYRERVDMKGGSLTTLSWRGTYLPKPLLAVARQWLEPVIPPQLEHQTRPNILIIPDGLWGLTLANHDQVQRAIELFAVDAPPIVSAQSVLTRPFKAEKLQERMRLFASAAAIIAVHGPALSFLLWAKPGSRVLEVGLRQQQAGWRLYQAPGGVASGGTSGPGGTAERPLWGKGYSLLARASGVQYTPMPAVWTDSESRLVVDPLTVVGWLSMPQRDNTRWPFRPQSFPHRFSTLSSSSTICNLPRSNQALRRPVRASSEVLSQQAWGAVDGDLSSRWSSQHTESEWLEVDLGESVQLCGVSVHWGSATPKSFEFQVASLSGGTVQTEARDYRQGISSKGGESGLSAESAGRGQVVIKEEDFEPSAVVASNRMESSNDVPGDMRDAIAAMLKGLGAEHSADPPTGSKPTRPSTSTPAPFAASVPAVGGNASIPPRRRLTENPSDMEGEPGNDRCSSVEGGPEAERGARAQGWNAWSMSDCIEAFPQHCDVQCAAPGQCTCKWSLGPSALDVIQIEVGGGAVADEVFPGMLKNYNGEWRPSGLPESGTREHQHRVQYGDFTDSAQTKEWVKAFVSSDVDAQSSRMSQQNQFWATRSYIFDEPMPARWLRFVGKERTYRAYGFEIAEMCAFPCPKHPDPTPSTTKPGS